jgi:hypothetical protein
MQTNKTQPTADSVKNYLLGIRNSERRADCEKLIELMSELTGLAPVMWGSIVGFGQYHYKYESGREGDSLRIGFANRANALTIYIMTGFENADDLLAKLGKFKIGKSCLYIKRLADIDTDVLRRMAQASLAKMRDRYGPDA